MSAARQCGICGRFGTRAFERLGGGWVCSSPKSCWRRRRSETQALHRAIQRPPRQAAP